MEFHALLLGLTLSFAVISSNNAERKKGEYYKGGKHNHEYDQKAFLGECQKNEFDKLTSEESL